MYTFKLWLKLLKMASGRRYPDQSIENEKKSDLFRQIKAWVTEY